MEFWKEGQETAEEDEKKLKKNGNADNFLITCTIEEMEEKKKAHQIDEDGVYKEECEEMEKDKTGFGILLGIFGGFPLGLIIGCMVYPPHSKERKSFVFAYWVALIAWIIACTFICVVVFVL